MDKYWHNCVQQLFAPDVNNLKIRITYDQFIDSNKIPNEKRWFSLINFNAA